MMIYFLFFFAGVALGLTTGGKYRPLLYAVYLMALVAAIVASVYATEPIVPNFVDF